MADLLIEFVGEEIPARMQAMAAQHLATAVKTALDELGVWTDVASIDGLCGPRHLAVYARGIAASQPDCVIDLFINISSTTGSPPPANAKILGWVMRERTINQPLDQTLCQQQFYERKL